MKRSFLTLTMVLLSLLTGTNAAWAQDELTPEQCYWVQLITKPSTGTGGSGKLYVTGDLRSFDYDNPAWRSDTSRLEGYSQVYIEISLGNFINVRLMSHAYPDEGSYFAGWSYSDGGTDLGFGEEYEPNWEKYKFTQYFVPSSSAGFANKRVYELYATFMPLLIESYAITGSNTTVSRSCTQTVTFRVTGSLADVNDFYRPTIIKQTGTGTWSIEPNTDELWYANKPGSSDFVYSDTYGDPMNTAEDHYAEIRVPVTFTADDDNAGEFSATLQLRSKAGKTMNVVLSARTAVAGAQAIRYNSSKVQQEAGNLTTLLTNASAGDIIKLNGNYSDAVSVDKNITFDLNGFTLNNTLTVSGGNVTLAYSPYGGSANALNVTGGKAILNGGTFGTLTIGANGTVEQNGAIVNGAVNNNGSLTTTDGTINGSLTSSKTLVVNGGTFVNNSGEAITVTGGTAQIKRGTITGQTYGVKTTGGSTTIEKLAAISGGSKALNGAGGTLTVNNGKFTDPSELIAGTVTFNAGYFQTATGPTALGKQVWRNTAGAEYREGYKFFVGEQSAAQASNVSVCRIGRTAYASLEDALAYANNNPNTKALIFMENDYMLQAGYYTIPANATLVVPKSDEQDEAYPTVEHISLTSGNYPTPYPFRTLTLADGVNLSVLGTIELTCPQYCKGGQRVQAVPGGPFGHLVLKPGSHIVLNSGAELRAWGYVTGDGTRDSDGTYLSGEIDARRGSIVREQFQMGDWKGGDISFTMAMDALPGQTPWRDLTHLFPIYTYFIQNVESPVKYHPGSALICATSVDVASGINAYANAIKVVGKEGEAAMFLMSEMADADNTWVRKWYDANKDQQVYEVNSGAQLGSLVIDLGEIPGGLLEATGKYHVLMDSRRFVLPLTNNFKIHLLSGAMQFTQSTSCLPGMEVEVDKESEISIIPSSDPTIVSGALYLYDADQWSFMNMQFGGYVGLAGDTQKYGRIVNYSATLNAKPTARDISSPSAIGDAKLIVHGTFRSASGCSVYTTWSKGTGSTLEDNPFTINANGTGGASIISTNEDAGTFIFDNASPAFDGVHWDDPANFGQLDHMTGFGPSVLVNFDNNNYGDNSYPIQIVTVLKQNSYQNYMEQCNNGDEESCSKINSTFTRVYGFELCTPAMLKNGDGTFAATEGTEAGKAYCYMNNRWTCLDVASEDPCFMKDNYGTFYAKPQEYVAVAATVNGAGKVVGNEDHTFSDKAGTGRLFILMNDCQWWEVEKKDNLYHCIHPDNDTYYEWGIGYDEELLEDKEMWVEKRFTITWKNWDGTPINVVIDKDGTIGSSYSVTYGTMAEFLGTIPTREANIDYTYNFTGWSPALGKVTSDVTYTATYQEQPRKYTIIFQNEGGDEIERQFLTHNEVPVCENTPTRTGFTLEWEPAIAAVTGDATYRATWLENPPTEYAITFYDYDGITKLKPTTETPYMVAVGSEPVAPANPANKPATSEFTYEFDHWSPELEVVSATSVKSYTAVYREVAKTYTVIFQNEDGSEIESHEYVYGATPVCSATPTKENTAEYTYSFAWDPQIQTVQGAATYRATFPATKNKYTVTLRSNNDAVCTFQGAGIYDYGKTMDINVSVNEGYQFVRWEEDPNLPQLIEDTVVRGDITLTAMIVAVSLDNHTVSASDTWDIPENTKINDLIVTSNGVTSGQLKHIENLTVQGDAIFWLKKSLNARTWYAVAVPWTVDVAQGLYTADNAGAPTAHQIVANTFDIIALNSEANAAGLDPKYCWNYVDEMDGLLHPGKAYLIYLTTDQPNGILLYKKSRTQLLTTSTNVITTGGSGARDNWNAIANPALYYANLATGASVGQTYDGLSNSYTPIDNIGTHAWIVGEPLFIQASAPATIVATAIGSSNPAPARRVARAENGITELRYTVELTQNGKLADRLFVATTDEKEDTYIIGQDVAKMGVSNKIAQMWVNRYDTKLCMNTIEPIVDRAEYPLTLFAPKAGEYVISAQNSAISYQNATLYLTRNGEAIWNLSERDYVLQLDKGTTNEYGLRVSARSPQVATGCDEVIADGAEGAQKVLVNDKIFIIRGNNVYTIDGQMVK